jgi:tetratricopeptide (TPR) repeat protein
LCISTVATVFAVNPTLALFGTHVRMLGLASIVDGVVTYFAAVHLVRQRRDVLAVVSCILFASLVMLGYEAIQLLDKDPFSWAGVDTSVRPVSTLGQATTLGQYLSMLSVGLLALAALSGGLHPGMRVSLVVYAALLLVGAGLTGTRAAFIGVAAAAGVFVLLVWAKHPSQRARLLSLISGLLAVAALTLLLLVTPLGSRLLSTVESPSRVGSDAVVGQFEPNTVVRVAMYDIALHMVAARPLLGFGPDNFAAAFPSFRPSGQPAALRQSVPTSTHSWIAATATSSGLLGLAAFIAVIGAAAYALFRSGYSSLAVAAATLVGAYLASGAVTINALETDTLFWLGIAATVGTRATRPRASSEPVTPERRRRRPPAPRSMLRRWGPWALVTAAIALCATSLPALEASRLARSSTLARAVPGTAALAIDFANQATRLDPSRADYFHQLALAYVAAGRWTDASVALQKAADLGPYDIRFLTDGIQVQLALARGGDKTALERAAQLADQAVRVDPNNPNGHLNRAVVAFNRGDLPAALASIDRALVLDPNPISAQLFSVSSQIYVAAMLSDVAGGRLDDAITKSRRGLVQLGLNVASVPVRLELARALARSGRSEEALGEIDAALALVPGDPALLQLKAEILPTGNRP